MNGKKYEYKDYDEYIKLQIKRSRRTKGMTRRESCNRRREWIYKRMTELEIEGKSILCLGARDEAEINFFENKGYEVDGIDLFNSGKVIECDMSRLLKHEYFKNKKYDIIFAMEAIEHCLNFEGLLEGINKLCKRYFICMSPICGTKIIQKPDNWETTLATKGGQKAEMRVLGELVEEEGALLVPKQFSEYIEINPDVMDGEPVIKDTRVPTSILATMSAEGMPITELAELYSPISAIAIEKAIEFEENIEEVYSKITPKSRTSVN